MGRLYLNTLYLHQEQVLPTDAAMFFTEAKTGQTKDLLSFYEKSTTGYFSCLGGDGEVRGIPLQHATSALDVTKSYILNL